MPRATASVAAPVKYQTIRLPQPEEFHVAAIISSLNIAFRNVKSWDPVVPNYECAVHEEPQGQEGGDRDEIHVYVFPVGWPAETHIRVRFIRMNGRYDVCQVLIVAPHIRIEGISLQQVQLDAIDRKGWVRMSLASSNFGIPMTEKMVHLLDDKLKAMPS